MRITLNGDLGSGKSTVGKQLAEHFGIPYISTGAIFRDIGKIQNMDALTTNLEAENNQELDDFVDNRIKEINATQDSFLLDSRMAWHFSTNAVNIYLSVTIKTAAERILSDTSRTGETYDSLEEAIESLKKRRNSELKRYTNLYDVNISDPEHYDLTIITDDTEISAIIDISARFLEAETPHKFWLPKCRIVPMVPLPETSGGENTATSMPADAATLPLCMEGNYGFYFGGGNALIDMLDDDTPLAPYREEQPEHLGAGSGSLLELAKTTITPSDLDDWEAAGDCGLSFRKELAADS